MALNIGITIFIKDKDSIWSNGIQLNALYLVRMLQNSEKIYNVFLLNTSEVKITPDLTWDTEKYKTVPYLDYRDKMDVVFILGGGLNKENANYLRQRKCKVVCYKCGNDYVINMENIIFGRLDQALDWPEVDEVWSIPQLMSTNQHYWRIMQNTETVRQVPFVWHPMCLDQHVAVLKKKGQDAFYTPSETKRISVFEPNVNVVKFAMYPVLILEQLHRSHPGLFKKAKITNTQKIRHSKQFTSLMLHLSVVRETLVTFEDRFPVTWFLAEHTDVVLSHQWENPLNYAYLDALYLRYPLVHNAYMVKDAGYYYDHFNVEEGAERLAYALKYHDANLDSYEVKSRKVLWRYHADNPEVVKQYDLLIENLFLVKSGQS